MEGEPSPESIAKIRKIAEVTEGEDNMCIIYASGTTGKPKGVVLTHNNYVNTIEIILEHVFDTDKIKRNLSFPPLPFPLPLGERE